MGKGGGDALTCSFGHRISHGTSLRGDSGDGRSYQKNPTIWVGVECWCGFAEKMKVGFGIGGPALFLFFFSHVIIIIIFDLCIYISFFSASLLFFSFFLYSCVQNRQVHRGVRLGEGTRTLSHSSSVKASRSTLEVNLVHP